jgi:peptidoglycan hydrolase-like protein with peptidoglycan-binding domain
VLDAVKYSTGGKNSACALDASFTAASMDGICGPRTDDAIRKFQADQKLEVTGKFDEATMAKLKELAEPKLAALKTAAPAQTEVAAAPTTPAPAVTDYTAIRTALADKLTLIQPLPDTPVELSGAEVKQGIDSAVKKLNDAGIKAVATDFTADDKGVVSSVIFGNIETILGMTKDSKGDTRLASLLDDPAALKALAPALNSMVSVAENTAPNAPAGARPAPQLGT